MRPTDSVPSATAFQPKGRSGEARAAVADWRGPALGVFGGRFLGCDHPLVRVRDALRIVGRQSLVVAVGLVTSVIAAAAGEAPWAPAVTASAGLVLFALAVGRALLRQHCRDHVLALVAAGREELPLVPVETERRRLLDGRTRSRLAASLERLVEDAQAASLMPVPRPFDRRGVGAVADGLLGLAWLLRCEPSNARGVALVWLLISDGAGSPLYGSGAADLRRELAGIRFLLSDGTVSGRGLHDEYRSGL